MSAHHPHFQPAWWLNNRHLQTIYPAMFRRSPSRIGRQRQRLLTEDMDFIDLDLYAMDENPIVLLLHGLAGSSDSGYILGLQCALQRSGFASVAINFRGCSGEPNRLARCYHCGDTDDLDFVWRTFKQRHPGRPIAAVGFSLGGSVLLNWLGKQQIANSLFAAVAVSVPLQLEICADKLDQGFSRIYRNYLLNDLKSYIHYKLKHLENAGIYEEAEKLSSLGNLSPIRSFWQYDQRVVAPLHGFSDVHDYYHRCSARQYLKSIQTPCLLINAKDDPFMNEQVLPKPDQLSGQVTFDLIGQGGHVGFVGGGHSPFGTHYWLEQRIPQFLQQQLNRLT